MDRAILLDQEFGKIPPNQTLISRCNLEKLKDWRCVATIHLDLIHKHSSKAFGLGKLLNLLIRPRLLHSKLIARECLNDKALVPILFQEYSKLFIVYCCQSSFGCNVCGKYNLPFEG